MFLILAKLQNLNLIKNFYLPAVMPNRPIHCNEETISDASCTTASLTIEATLVFPFFILVFLTIIYWLNIFSIQTGLQIQLEESARKYNTTAYKKCQAKEHKEMVFGRCLLQTHLHRAEDEITKKAQNIRDNKTPYEKPFDH